MTVPFADEVTTAWIAEKVNEEGLMYGDEPATVVNGQADDVLLLESEAMEKETRKGPKRRLPGSSPDRGWTHHAIAG
jgi:type VI secretion system protein VasJ